MTRVLLLRHGQSTWNAEGRWQGWADPPLSAAGEEQARQAAVALRGAGFDRIVSSDLVRAVRTAEVMAAELGVAAVERHPGLRERDVGEWSGCTTAEIEARWPGQLQAWRDGHLEQPPGGESRPALSERVMAAVAALAAGDGVLLAVTHGGVIRLVERRLGIEASAPGNLCGRWIESAAGGPGLVAGPVLVAGAPAGQTTTVL